MNITKVLIEFLVTFIVIYLFYYFLIIRKCKKNKNVVPAEVNLILLVYKIDVKKIDIYGMIKVVSLTTTIILALIITLISEFFTSTIILLIFGTLISVLVAIIIYRMIGKYYEKQSRLNVNKTKQKNVK